MKYSRQRELIRNVMRGNRTHPTANDVYLKLKEVCPSLSLGTVYRNLNLLVENGEIERIEMPNGCDRFDGNPGQHYHAVCTSCEKVFDLTLPQLRNLQDLIHREIGMDVERLCLTIKGICPQCQQLLASQSAESQM
ncbi:MAG: transcriptional repressor [Firmicutes bacterium]|nr:transcriptional repressor [Bacillota bacterium]